MRSGRSVVRSTPVALPSGLAINSCAAIGPVSSEQNGSGELGEGPISKAAPSVSWPTMRTAAVPLRICQSAPRSASHAMSS